MHALEIDAEAQPPHGESGQAELGVSPGEGHAAFGADGPQYLLTKPSPNYQAFVLNKCLLRNKHGFNR